MPRSRHHYDVYDDTNLGDERYEMERHRGQVARREHRDRHRNRDVVDPFQEMDHAMRRLHEQTERSLGAWGFGPMFGDSRRSGGGLFPSFFDDAFPSMPDIAESARDGRGTYYFESKTRTVGPDGRVHEEHVRTTPDQHGNPETKRTVRDAESEREMDPFWRGLRSPFGREPYGMIEERPRNDDVIVEELESSDDEDRRGSHRSRSSRKHRDDVDVEVIDPEGSRSQQRPGRWMRERYDRWKNRA